MAPQPDETLPKHDHLEEAVLLIEKAIDAGQTPSLQDYLDRYPDLAPDLTEFFADQEKMTRLLKPLQVPDPKLTPSFHEDAPPLPNVPGYEILGLIAQGGMAIVYKARHIAMKRIAALKIIRPERSPDETSRQRFQTEARIIAKFNHPNIVHIWDYNSGEEDDCPYIAMEYVPGGNLADSSKGQSWPARRAAALVAKIADAVQYAHRHGIIHRDLKCANVLLTEADDPKIADFGLAKDLLPGEALSTGAGVRIGTPAFMSPEQANGEAEAIGAATDVFGLGAILYELLTGRPPYQGETSGEVLAQARQGDVQPPRETNSRIPKALEKICLKALAAKQDQRYESAAALARELRRFAAWPWRWAIVLGSVLGVLLLVGLAASALLMRPNNWGMNAPGQIEPQKYEGYVDVLLWTADGRKLRLNDSGALPAPSGSKMRIEAEVNPGAYLYLFWINSEGEVSPIHPWQPGKWNSRPPQEKPRTALRFPETLGKAWTLKGKDDGMETLLLLARNEPLPLGDDKIRKLFAGLPPQRPVQKAGAVVWFEGGHIIKGDRKRQPDFVDTDVNDPVLRLQALLQQRLEPLAAFTTAVSFARKQK